MADYDIVVRGGTIADGTGSALYEGDVAIKDGKIAAVGTVTGAGKEEIDAKGKLVTPGFVDIHTHFDGQITWDTSLKPSAGHGVTTVVMGNCGVGFAPCKPHQRDAMVEVMEGVEDIPGIVMAEGLPWNWETFPDYLDAIEQRHADVDFAAQVPHIPVRVYAMGQRGVNREPAQADDIKLMADLVKEALEAGALGFTTSRTVGHRTASGDVCPSTTAAEDELMAIAMAMKEADKGVFMSASDFGDTSSGTSLEFELLRRIAETSGRPVSFPLLENNDDPQRWVNISKVVEKALDDGLTMYPQVCGRPVGVIYGFELSSHPFSGCASYIEIADLPLAERVEKLRDPELKAKIIAEEAWLFDQRVLRLARSFNEMYRMGNPPNYSPPLEERLDKVAEARGVTPESVAYDIMLEQDGNGLIYHPATNFSHCTLDTVLNMMKLPYTVMGVGDGGAHLGRICDSSYPTHLLSYWTRDREGERLTIPQVVKSMTTDTARVVGLNDRGRIAPGFKGDLNVIDYENLTLHPPRASFDLPAGGVRLAQNADGYIATILSGVVTYRNSEATGELPGRLVRGAREVETALAA